MNLLLDTHVLIWALNEDARLSEKARELILDPDHVIYYSSISIWVNSGCRSARRSSSRKQRAI